MMNIAMVMDIAILVLLAATVWLAFRLNLGLKHFKDSRKEMEGLVTRLTSNIDKAERAIQGMQQAARTAGRDLDEVISDAKVLSDELKFMNEAGNNLATRLEKIAERNREASEKIEERITVTQVSSSSKSPQIKLDDSPRGFAIHDRDFDAALDDEDDFDEFEDLSDEDFGGAGLQSQAERELFEALQKGKARRTV